MKKKNILFILLDIIINVNAQIDTRCYSSLNKRTICFTDDNKFSVELWIGGNMMHCFGFGTYMIERNHIMATFNEVVHKDTSFYTINHVVDNNNEICIRCKVLSDNIEYPCESIEWWISDSIRVPITEKSFVGIDSKIRLSHDYVGRNMQINFSGFNIKTISIPLENSNNYNVVLKKEKKYIEQGNLIFKIKKKKGITYLKMMNGEDYVGLKTMDFY